VHGHGNCFVVSTAAWPTVGTANPTLTLAALALRAVETIRKAAA
jgi:choline dehydrogenase-like flavoprotein